MRKLIGTLAMVIALSACTTGYNATPTSEHTPDSIPKCFVIERYDDGEPDNLGAGSVGLYCLEEK